MVRKPPHQPKTASQSVSPVMTPAELIELIKQEGPLSIPRAVKCYPVPTSPQTATRHHLQGVKRPDGRIVRLEAARFGGRLFTSEKRVLAFLARLNEPLDTLQPSTPAYRRHEAEAASVELDAILNDK